MLRVQQTQHRPAPMSAASAASAASLRCAPLVAVPSSRLHPGRSPGRDQLPNPLALQGPVPRHAAKPRSRPRRLHAHRPSNPPPSVAFGPRSHSADDRRKATPSAQRAIRSCPGLQFLRLLLTPAPGIAAAAPRPPLPVCRESTRSGAVGAVTWRQLRLNGPRHVRRRFSPPNHIAAPRPLSRARRRDRRPGMVTRNAVSRVGLASASDATERAARSLYLRERSLYLPPRTRIRFVRNMRSCSGTNRFRPRRPRGVLTFAITRRKRGHVPSALSWRRICWSHRYLVPRKTIDR